MAFRWSRIGAAALLAMAALASGCDDGQTQGEEPLPLPKGDNPLDGLLNASVPRRPDRPAKIEASPAGVDFSDVTVGRSVDNTIELVNSGNRPAKVKRIRLAGSTDAFRLGGSCHADTPLAGGETCTVEVTFSPPEATMQRGDIVVTVDGVEQEPLFLSLQGRGVEPEVDSSSLPPVVVEHVDRAQASLVYASARQGKGLDIQRAVAPALDASTLPHEDDYKVAGLPGIVSTFPVDRSRVITADRYIPAVLENTLNSQLGGRAIAVVERHVYGADGRQILLPAGSRAIGTFGTLGKAGSSRLGIVWSRIIRPDGVSINIADKAADVMGRTGLPGDLDTRFFEKYGSSLLTSAISAAAMASLGDNTTTTVTNSSVTQGETARGKAIDQFGEDLSDLGQRMINENVDLTPVLTVAQGTRLVIVPTEDIWLRDPNRIVAVTQPKDSGSFGGAATSEKVAALAESVPKAMQALLSNPSAVNGMSPQALQQMVRALALQNLGLASQPGEAGDRPAAPSTGGSP